jgi:hypothetical protein
MKIGVTVVALALLAAALASPALAAGPPKGRYNCASGYYIKIKAGNKYAFSVSPGGKFKYKKAGHKIVFTSGYLKKDWFGVLRKDANGGDPIIDLHLKSDPGAGDHCEK